MRNQVTGWGFDGSNFEDFISNWEEIGHVGVNAKEEDGLEDTRKNVSSDARAGLNEESYDIAPENGDANSREGNKRSELGTSDCSVIYTELAELRGSHVCNAMEEDIVSSKSIARCTKQIRPGDECQLSGEVVERILAMIPFPQVLKVRALSRTWYEKFPLPNRISKERPLLPYNDNNGNTECSFEKLVSSGSWRWSVYCPVIVADHGLIGYDPVHKLWLGLCVNLHQLLGEWEEPWLTSSRGPLICGVSQSRNSVPNLFVTNVLTKSSRKLPSHPNQRVPSLLNLVFDAPNSYKVLLVTEDPFDGPYDDREADDLNPPSHRCISSQLFDSRDGTWTISQSEIPAATSFAWRSCSVYFEGLFYCLSGDDRKPIDNPLQLWVHDPKEGFWLEIHHPFKQLVNVFSGLSVTVDLSRFQLVVCDSKIMVVVAFDPKTCEDRVAKDSIHMFELNPETRVITWQSSGPPAAVLGNSEHIATDGSNIYFCTFDLEICCPVLVYNVKCNLWSCLGADFKTARPLTNKRWAGFSFQPGLNPFISP